MEIVVSFPVKAGSVGRHLYCMASSTIAFPSMCCLPDHCVVLAERAIWCWLGIARIDAWCVGGHILIESAVCILIGFA